MPQAATLKVEALSAAPPGGDRLVVADVNFTLNAGQGLGVIGPSAAGKSSLARLLVGVWQPTRGKVRLDGAALDQWDEEVARPAHRISASGRRALRRVRSPRTSRGSIPRPTRRRSISAAQAAGVHDLIVRLRDGYDTELRGPALGLSAGQQQRIALARALYGDPFLVVLDEPNSNLDANGEAALTQAILGVRKRGGIVVVVSHRSSALAGVDMVLVMNQGRATSSDPRTRCLPRSRGRRPSSHAQQPQIRAVPESGSLAS